MARLFCYTQGDLKVVTGTWIERFAIDDGGACGIEGGTGEAQPGFRGLYPQEFGFTSRSSIGFEGLFSKIGDESFGSHEAVEGTIGYFLCSLVDATSTWVRQIVGFVGNGQVIGGTQSL